MDGRVRVAPGVRGHLLLALATMFHPQPPWRWSLLQRALEGKARGPSSNLRNAKGQTDRSCHPLPDSLPVSTSFSSPWCPLPDQQRQSLLHTPRLLRPPMPSSNLSPGHRERPPCRLPSAHRRNGFWQPQKDK